MKIFYALLFGLFLTVCSHQNAWAKQTLDTDIFKKIPIQHEGRIKPISSFAASLLYTFSGHESLNGQSAQDWLAQSLFDPSKAIQTPVFRTFQPELFGLPKKDKPYYSLSELAPKLQDKLDVIQKIAALDPKTLSKDQIEILRLRDNAEIYIQLLRSFSFLLPLQVNLPPAIAEKWGIQTDKPFSLDDYKKIESRVSADIKKIIRKKGEDPAKYSPEELAITTFGFEMQIMEQGGDQNVLFRIVPGLNTDEWFSPWSLRLDGQGSPKAQSYLSLWQDLTKAYLLKDSGAWDKAAEDIIKQSSGFAGADKINIESLYTGLHPWTWALAFYVLSFGFVLLHLGGIKGPWYTGSIVLLFLGFLFNLAAIGLRMVILERPPVGTLYESILFVALLCAGACLFMERKRRDGNGLIAGSLCGAILLFTAQSFTDGDTLKVLVAVLNTNFWLTTHVLTITAGYAWCLVVSLLAHLWLLKAALGRDPSSLMPAIKLFTLIALLFTSVGTILGGIWADQSWGRFWGWDPKENGALLIVLWIVWVLHAQITRHLNDMWAAAMLACLSIIVSLAWFGVNLLNVGLHSYGFISGMAYSLSAFIAFELFVIGFLVWKMQSKQGKPA